MSQQDERDKASKTRKTFEVAGKLPDSEQFKNFPPIAWIAELVQHLVAVLILAMGKMIQLTFKKEKPSSRQRQKEHAS